MADYTVRCNASVNAKTLTHPNEQVADYLDLQAEVDNGEEEELLEDELGEPSREQVSSRILLMAHLDNFFVGDDDPTESVADWPTRHSSFAIGNFEQEAAEMQALVDSRRIRAPTNW